MADLITNQHHSNCKLCNGTGHIEGPSIVIKGLGCLAKYTSEPCPNCVAPGHIWEKTSFGWVLRKLNA